MSGDKIDDASGQPAAAGGSTGAEGQAKTDKDLQADLKGLGRPVDPDLLEKIQAETQATSSENEGEAPDFVAGGGDKIGQTSQGTLEEAMSDAGFTKEGGPGAGRSDDDTPNWARERIVPAWPAVLSTSSNITGQIRKAVQRHFLDNEMGEKETGMRSGRLDMGSVIRSRMSGRSNSTDAVYARRRIPENKAYEVYILVDISGSMCAPVEGAVVDPTVFGLYGGNQRWMMAARLTVALTEMLQRCRGVKVAIGVHNHAFMPLKAFNDRLNEELKTYIMEQVRADGGTEAGRAYSEVAKLFKESKAQRKLLIHLTDGVFGGEVRKPMDELKKSKVDMTILTVGIDASSAREFVPADHAYEVDDESIGLALNAAFKRMIA